MKFGEESLRTYGYHSRPTILFWISDMIMDMLLPFESRGLQKPNFALDAYMGEISKSKNI